MTQALLETQKKLHFECCSNPALMLRKGEYVCRNCGTVHGAELTFNVVRDIVKKEKAHYFYLSNKHSLLTPSKGTTFHLREAPPAKKGLFYRLGRLNRLHANSRENNFRIARKLFLKFGSQLELSIQILEYGFQLYKAAVKARLSIGRGMKQFVMGTIYLACNQNAVERDIGELARVSGLTAKQIRNAYHLFLREFPISLKRFPPKYYVRKFATHLRVSPSFQQKVAQLYTRMVTHPERPAFLNKKGIIAGIFYFLNRNVQHERKIRQSDLAELANVSEVTIRKYVQLVRKVWRGTRKD